MSVLGSFYHCHILLPFSAKKNVKEIAVNKRLILFLSVPSSSRPHSQPGAAVAAPAAVPLSILHPDTVRAAGPEGRDVRPHQHGDGHRVRLSLPERRGASRGEGEGQADRGRVGLGEGGGVSPSAVHAAFAWAQHRRPAGHPGLCRYTPG